MYRQHNSFRPHLERLESRENPSNLMVSYANHTLTVHGETANGLTVEGNVGDATQFTIASSGSDTFNGNPSPYSSPSGVQNITFDLTGGGENVDFDDAVRAIDLEGNLTINTGTGANTVEATDLTVTKNLAVTNGPNTATTSNIFTNLNVGGNVTIHNGNGDAQNAIYRSSAGISTIGGNLSITNNAGQHINALIDTNVGGNVTINNGTADPTGSAGYTEIYNLYNTGFRSVIKGNLTISYTNGNGYTNDALCDTEIGGNVTFNHGTGTFVTNFGGYVTTQPVAVGGNLTITGSGINNINVGLLSLDTGMIVGKNFIVSIPQTGSGGETLTLNRLVVDGATNLNLLSGSNTVDIDQSQFVGTFTMTCDKGDGAFDVERASGDTLPTEFDKAVKVTLGGGSSSAAFASASATNEIIFASTVVLKDLIVSQAYTDQIDFLFGGTL